MEPTPSAATEITMVAGAPVIVEGDVRAAETAVVNAARGSILEIAWFKEAGTGRPVGINPDHVVALRALSG